MDLALSLDAPVIGDIREALALAGFSRTFHGEDAPPVTHYNLADDAGFYAEFLAPLHRGEIKRNGKRDVAAAKAGITAQKLRHLDLLLIAQWSVQLGQEVKIPLERCADVLLPNPVSFLVQKLLIHDKRQPNKQAQDVLYIHDTLELFGGAQDELRSVWTDQVRPQMPDKTARQAQKLARTLFEEVTDTVREAARMPPDRSLSPEVLRGTCQYGLSQILLA